MPKSVFVFIGFLFFVTQLQAAKGDHATSSEALEDSVTKPDLNAFSSSQKRRIYVKFDPSSKQYWLRECDYRTPNPRSIDDCPKETELQIAQDVFEATFKANYQKLNPSVVLASDYMELAMIRAGTTDFAENLKKRVSEINDEMKKVKDLRDQTSNPQEKKTLQSEWDSLNQERKRLLSQIERIEAENSERISANDELKTEKRRLKKQSEDKATEVLNKIKESGRLHKNEHWDYASEIERAQNVGVEGSKRAHDNGAYLSIVEVFDRPATPCNANYDFQARAPVGNNPGVDCKTIKNSVRGEKKNWTLFKIDSDGQQFWKDETTGLVWGDPSNTNMSYMSAVGGCAPPQRLPSSEEIKNAKDLFAAFPVLEKRWSVWVQNPEFDKINPQNQDSAPKGANAFKGMKVKRYQIQDNKYDSEGKPQYIKKILMSPIEEISADRMCVVSLK